MKTNTKKKAFFGSISSDLAFVIASEFIKKGWIVEGTYRNESDLTENLKQKSVILHKLDFNSFTEIDNLIKDKKVASSWDFMMISPSMLGRTGNFSDIEWSSWVESFNLNSINQFKLIHSLLPRRNFTDSPMLWLWSGPGTNNAPKEHSAVVLAKIAQIKLVEILNEEYEDLIPFIVGPGWVKTKTHDEILSLGPNAGYKYFQTKDRIENGNFTKIEKIVDFFNWILFQDKKTLGGRNFSIGSDIWGNDSLISFLKDDLDAFKLRRFQNDWRPNKDYKTDFKPK